MKHECVTARQSGPELLKIFAILLIITFHFTQTVSSPSDIVPDTGWVIEPTDFCEATSIGQVFQKIFLSFGEIGNNLFFISSAWFLLESKKTDFKKIVKMMVSVWLISIAILALTILAGGTHISGGMIIKCLLPTSFSNNWYITNYLIFYSLHPALNRVIEACSQKQLRRFVEGALFLCCVWNPLLKEWNGGKTLPYLNNLSVWVAFYCLVAYLKRHDSRVMENVRACWLLLLGGMLGWFAVRVGADRMAAAFPQFDVRIFVGYADSGLFPLMTALGLFGLFRKFSFKSRAVNRISSMSLLIYIIHENILLRQQYRPRLFARLYEKTHYSVNEAMLWILILAVSTFIASGIISFLYQKTVNALTDRAVDSLFAKQKAREEISD